MENKFKRFLSLVVAIVMVFGMFPMNVFATEGESTPEAQAAEPITGTITEDTVWNDGDVIGGVTIAGNVTITVNGTVTVAGTIRLSPDAICDVTFNGEKNAKLIRGGDFTGQMFYAEGKSGDFQNLTFNSITLDGGAVWTGDVDKTLNRGTTNSGVKATGSVLYLVYADAELNYSALQNHDDSTGEKANAVFLRYYSTIEFKNSVVKDNYSPSTYYSGGVVTVRQGGTVKTNNAEVYGNAGPQGGFFGVSSTGSYGGVCEVYNSKFHNNYSDAGAVFDMQCNSKVGYLLIDGCEFYDNASNCGLIYEHAYSRPVIIKDSYFHDNECAVWDCHTDPVLDLSGKIVIEEDADYTKYLFETPLALGSSLSAESSIAISEASKAQLMKNWGFIVTGTTEYAVTESDLSVFSIPEGQKFIDTDVDFNNIIDQVLVPSDFVERDIQVTLKDSLNENNSEVKTVIATLGYRYICSFDHVGYTLTGWLNESNKVVNGLIAHDADATLVAQWKLANPVVTLARKDSGENINTLVAAVTNAEEGISYTYQWYKNGTAIDGATSTEYTIDETAKYKCTVTASAEGFKNASGSKEVSAELKEVPDNSVAVVNGTKYETLKEAVAAANELDTATVTLLKNVTLGEKLTISGNVTIEGAYTITRDDAYTGTLFEVKADAELTLDGDLTIDGGNVYKFDSELYAADLKGFAVVPTAESQKWFTPEEGAPVATAFMIVNNGTLNLNDVTVQNNYSTNSGVVTTGVNSTTTLKGAKITHVASTNSNGVVVKASGTGIQVFVEDGTVIDGNHVGGNHGLFMVYSGATLTMNGGEIKNTTGWNSNGIAVGVYWGTFNLNGGTICSNTSANGPSNGRCAAVYLHSGHQFKMTGGTICCNRGGSRGGLDAPYSNGSTVITGGSILDNSSYYVEQGYGASYPADVNGNSVMSITGGTYTQDVSKWVAPGYGCTIIPELSPDGQAQYIVTDEIASIGETIYHSVQDAVDAAKDGDTIKVLASHKPAETIVINKNVTLDLNGKNIYGYAQVNPIVRVLADVTVTGNGMIDSANQGEGYCFIVGSNDASGNLTIANGTFKGTTSAISVTKGKLTILDGDFRVKPYTDDAGNSIYSYLLNCIDANYRDGSAVIEVKGGVYTGFNPDNCAAEGTGTDFVPEGYVSEELTTNKWTVSKVYNYVAQVKETGEKYESLSEAVAAANAIEGGATVTLLKNVTLGEKLTISGNVTIEGAYTITRDDAYTGTLFEVPAGASLTLDGDLVIDGGNNWTLNKTVYDSNLENGVKGTKRADVLTAEANAPKATAAMFVVNGTVNANRVTIQNSYSDKDSNVGDSTIFKLAGTASLTMTGATFKHIATGGANAVVYMKENTSWTINEGTLIDDTFAGRNGGVSRIDGYASIVMNGGTISNNRGINVNGTVFMFCNYATFEMNGGTICSNSGLCGTNNGRLAPVYLHDSSSMTMTGGNIYHNTGYLLSGIDIATANAKLTITDGNVYGNETISDKYNYDDVAPGDHTSITGGWFSQDVTEFCADNYAAIKEYNEELGKELYHVVDYIAWVKAQLLAGNDVTLIRDIKITDYSYVNALKLPSNGNGKYDERHGNGAVFHVTKPGVELDLNGYDIVWDAHDDAYCNARQVSLFMVTATGVEGETAELTIKDSVGDSKVEVYGMGTGLYSVCVDAKGTIEGGTWTNYPCSDCGASNIFLYPSHGGEMYITGGTFEQKDSEYLLGWKGSTKETTNNGVGNDMDETLFSITGGTFVGLNPELTKFFDVAASGQETINAVAEGYAATQVAENTWIVNYAVAEVVETGVKYGSLQDAINACTNGETVKLLVDITYTDADKVHPCGANTGYDQYGQYYNCIIYTAGTQGATAAENTPSQVNAILDLNGHSITSTASESFLFILLDNTKLTITGKGSINNGEYPVIWTAGTETLLTIEGGKYTTTGNSGVFHVTHSSDLVINGGEFDSTAAGDSALIWRNEQPYNNPNNFQVGAATVTITGGTYYGFNPESTPDDYKGTHYFNAVAEGYAAVEVEENVWTVNPVVTVKFDDVTMVEGNEVPKFTYTTDFTEVAEDGEMLIVENPVVNVTGAGEYEITANASVFLSDKYYVRVIPGKLTVKEALAEANGVNYATIQDAINASNKTSDNIGSTTITVLKDHIVDVNTRMSGYPMLVNGKDVILDLNGKVVTFDYSVKTGATVYASIRLANSAKLTIKDSSEEKTGTLYNKNQTADASRIIWIASNCTTVIEGGNFINDQHDTMFYTSNSNKEVPTTLYIKGGNFQQVGLTDGKYHDCFNQQDGYQKQIIELTGGTYNEHPKAGPQNDWEVTIPEGYTVIDNGDGTWSVAPYVTVTFDDKTMFEGKEVPELTYTVNYNYVPEDAVNVAVTVTPIVDPAIGTYTITGTVTLTDGTGKAENYGVKVVEGTLTVEENPIVNVTVKVNDITYVEGNEVPAYGYTTDVECPELTVTYTEENGVINATVAPMDGYEFTVVPGTLTVEKAVLRVYAANNAKVKYFSDVAEGMAYAISMKDYIPVYLMDNVTIDETIVINDTNGGTMELQSVKTGKNTYTLTSTCDEPMFKIEKGIFNLKNMVVDAKGDAFYVTGGTCNLLSVGARDNNGQFTEIYSQTGNCVYVRGGSVSVKGVVMTAYGEYPAIQGNGNYAGNVTITRWNSYANSIPVISAPNSDMAIYWPGNGKLTIELGTITGDTALYAKSGKITITGGEFYGNGEKVDFQHSSNGAYATGDAVVIENCKDAAYETPVVSVTGGTFVSDNAKAIAVYNCNESTKVEKFISGGTYNTDVDDELVVEGKFDLPDGKQEWWNIYDGIVTVDGVWYDTWAEARAALQTLDTDKVNADCEVVIYVDIDNRNNVNGSDGKFSYGDANKTLTLDLNGHNFTTSYMGKQGHEWLHITDSAEGGSVNVTGYVGLYSNGYMNVDSDVDFNGKLQINFQAYKDTGSTGCFLVDGVKVFGRGHYQQDDGIFGTTGGYVTLSNGLENVTVNSGSFTLNQDTDILADSNVVIESKATVDLNGNDLTAKKITSFGNLIDSADGVGALTVEDIHYSNHANMSYLPLYDTEDDCYRLCATEVVTYSSEEIDETTVKVKYRIYFTNRAAYLMLKDTIEKNHLTLSATWTGSISGEVTEDFSAENLAEYAEMADYCMDEFGEVKVSLYRNLKLDDHVAGDIINAKVTLNCDYGVAIDSDTFVYTVS